MEISNAHQYQAMGSSSSNILPLEEVLVGCSKTSSSQQHQEMRKVMKPHPDQSLKCPRCDSTNTKFCYYNNYSLSQPRYYCKGCRRYWTKGGSLRNVPIGGGCRKNKKSSSSSSSSSSTSSKRPHDSNSNPHLSSFMAPSHLANYDPSHDHLTLAFADLHKQPLANGFFVGNPSSGSSSSGFLDILRGGFVNSVANNQSDWNSLYGIGCNGDGVQEVEDVVMPFNVGFDGATTYTTTTTTTTSAHDNMAAAMDSGRDYWNGVAPPPPSSWHGLINNSLM